LHSFPTRRSSDLRMKMKYLKSSLTAAGLLLAGALSAQTAFHVKAGEVKGEVQPTMWGLFFEDINFGADGGIYAELIKNRSFEFYQPLMGWKIQRKEFNEGEILVQNRGNENPANPRYITVTAKDAKDKSLGMTNEGFRGMGIKDRKSTRLNSSHVKISYAVFCL